MLDVMPALLYLSQLPWWWYVFQSQWWWRFGSRTLLLTSDKFALQPQLASLFAPYHNDLTFVGRLLGFAFRLIWIIVACLALLAIGLALLASYSIWLLWPVGLLVGIWLGGWSIAWGLVATLTAAMVFWFGYVLQPKYHLDQYQALTAEGKLNPDQLRDLTAGSARKILRDLPRTCSTGSLIKALASTRRMQRLFKRMELSDQQLLSRLIQAATKQSQVVTQDQVIQQAVSVGLGFHHQFITSTDLFLGLIHLSPLMSQVLVDVGMNIDEVVRAIQWIEAEDAQKSKWKWWTDANFHRLGGVDRGWTSGWTPTLRQFTTDVSSQVAAGRTPYIVGRSQEIGEVVRILERTTKNNVLLLGEPGVGKSSIVDGIAQAILDGEASGVLAEHRVVQLDLGTLLTGVDNNHELEQRFTQALDELAKSQTILFIDAIEHLVTQTGSGTLDATALLLPYLENGKIKAIGATTVKEFHRTLEPRAEFTSQFQAVTIAEPDPETARTIVQEFAAAIEARQGVMISLPAIDRTVTMASQYLPDRVLPEKAIDLLDEVAAAVAHQKRQVVEAEDVAQVIADKTGIPVTNITQDEASKLNTLEQLLHQRIIGQDKAVEVVANALRRSRAGLRNQQKPMAVLLFVGPTGVGKTELAKTIAESYFGNEEAMIRLDMSEYQQPSDIQKLIGAPAGYGESGYLTTAVKDHPYSVILLDELEKANQHILDLFLQVFDDGRLTDAQGTTVSFAQTIIIATSNAGAKSIQDAIAKGYTTDQITPAVKQMLTQKFFKPEFLNRFDDIVVFKALTLEETSRIVELMLQGVVKEMADKGISLSFAPDLVAKLAQVGYDPLYGARPLRHVIQDKVENTLAKQLLSNTLKRGQSLVLNLQNIPF